MIQKIISPPHSWHDHESPLCSCVDAVTWLANVLHIKLSGDTSEIAAGFNVTFNAIYFNNNVYQGKIFQNQRWFTGSVCKASLTVKFKGVFIYVAAQAWSKNG